MSKSLAICMSRAVTIYFLAWVREYGSGREFDLIVSSNQTLPNRYINLLSENGITCVETGFAQDQTYENLILQPYEGFASHENLLEKFNFKKIIYFSDCLRNGMFSFPKLDPRTSEFIYFGFELVESAFIDNLTSNQRNISRSIVSVENISSTWNELLGLYSEFESASIMQQNDLLITMRHWGMAPQYTLLQDNLQDYLLEEFDGYERINRVIYRGHPWVHLDFDSNINRHLSNSLRFANKAEFVRWEDLFKQNIEFPELTSPEGEIWKSEHQLGLFFGFDGSLNTLVNLRCPQTEIIYPKKEIYKKYFKYEKSTNLVSEQVQWQKDLAAQMKNSIELSKICIATSGRYYEKLIIELIRQGGDGLVAERDGLVAERDGLAQSTIWRASKPIRWFLDGLKKLLGYQN
jgi:hypothetical protein